MMGYASLLSNSDGEAEKAKQYIESIKETVDRGASLTSRLLSFSRQTVMVPVAVNVTALVNGLQDMLQRTLGETIELRAIETPLLWAATMDEHQFENAMVNLAINARDAMPNGGTLTIQTTNVTLDENCAAQHDELNPGDYVEICVSDSGAGIPLEVRRRPLATNTYSPMTDMDHDFFARRFPEGGGQYISLRSSMTRSALLCVNE